MLGYTAALYSHRLQADISDGLSVSMFRAEHTGPTPQPLKAEVTVYNAAQTTEWGNAKESYRGGSLV